MTFFPRCFDCKYFIDDKRYTCNAFPEGIPKDILHNKSRHDRVIKGQVGNYIFVSKEEEIRKKEKRGKILNGLMFGLAFIYIFFWGTVGEPVFHSLEYHSTVWWLFCVWFLIPYVWLFLYGLLWLFNKIYKFFKNW